jgi:AraC-like DNA-binding protein
MIYGCPRDEWQLAAHGRWAQPVKQADVASLRMPRKARDRIGRDHREDISIVTLASGAGYSREHFIRAFRAAYGETPGRYRTRRRVERACELLRKANLTVTEICRLVGFTSLGTFSARFAEITGMFLPAIAPRPPVAVVPPPHTGMLRADVAGRPARADRSARTSRLTHHFQGSARLDLPNTAGAMINGISIVSVLVLDQDSAKDFCTRIARRRCPPGTKVWMHELSQGNGEA